MNGVNKGDKDVALYESGLWQRQPDSLRRPGGFRLTERLLKIGQLLPGARVVDVGCGAGGTVRFLRERGYAAWGVEPSITLREVGKYPPGVMLLEGSGTDLPMADESVDAVLAECSLSVMECLDLALQEFRRVLNPTGVVLLSDMYFRRGEGVAGFRRQREGGAPGTFIACLRGAMTHMEWEHLFWRQGYQVLFWEDVSYCLGELVARMLMDPDGESCTTGLDEEAIRAVRPGYFLLVAKPR